MPTHAQQLRNLEFRTSLPADSLLLHSFQYEDALARPFHINATLLSEDFDLELAAAIGHDASLRVRGNTPTPRFFHGLIAEFALVGSHGRFAQYHALIVPRLWLLSRTSDCRIFQQKTIPEIVSGILNEHSVEHELALSARYNPWEYCVQYRETDLDFVLRLLEHEGICFFFEHAKDHHKLVLADSPAAHGPLPSAPTLRFHSSKDAAAHERIRQWVVSQQLQPTRLALNDFDFKGPAKDLRTDSAVARSHLHTGLEVYDYPGKFAARDEGERYAKVRLEEVQSQHHTIRADADVTALATGFTFTLNSHPRRDQNRAHLITSLRIDAKADDFESTSVPNPGHFLASFTAVPADIPFRPRRATQRPIIPGPQTAIVVGESSKEIDTDEHARVKVQFHWDRYGKKDQNSSCWIRVSQPWAGKGYGGINMPRTGVEVIVEFLEGDPDKPIITGRVYNERTMPYGSQSGVYEQKRSQSKHAMMAAQAILATARPATAVAAAAAGAAPAARASSVLSSMVSALPTALNALSKLGGSFDPATISAPAGIVASSQMTSLKSNSLGGSGGSNEICMNDAAGAEALFMKAQKDEIHTVNNDMIITVLNNMLVEVMGNRTTSVHSDDTLIVDSNAITAVSQEYRLSVGADFTTKVNASAQTLIGDKHELTISKTSDITIGDNCSLTVSKSQDTEIGEDSKLAVGRDQTTIIKGKQDITVEKTQSLTVKEDQTTTFEKNQTITIKGDEKATIEKTATVEVTDKITVNGKKTIDATAADEVTIKCGPCSFTMKKSGDLEIKGTNIKITATAALENSGATIASAASTVHEVKGALVKINC